MTVVNNLTGYSILYSLTSNLFNDLSDYYWLQSLALVQEAGWSKGGTYYKLHNWVKTFLDLVFSK